MPAESPVNSPKSLDFSDTPFHHLMQRRVYTVLLACSEFDAFTLEEDGRIDEQIFNEYTSLNLRYPPSFIQAHTPDQAYAALSNHSIDLIIGMHKPGDWNTLDLLKNLKAAKPGVPVVVLSHYSHESYEQRKGQGMQGVDLAFIWLGNADLLLAIIKLVEDRMNAHHDILTVGAQAILVVEGSERAYSSILPELYKLVMRQARSFMWEGLNEHRQTLRMRGRPKILLARDLDQAQKLYDRFKPQVMGVIADTWDAQGTVDPQCEGLRFCQRVRAQDPFLPFLLQSENPDYAPLAHSLGVGFLHKHSKTYPHSLREYIVQHFGFGDFVFMSPTHGREEARAANLRDMQRLILTVSGESLEYHSNANHLSRWFNARALFPLARLFRPLALTDFESIDHAREFFHQAISAYRHHRGQGVVAQFRREAFDAQDRFSRIGQGSMGGKARGLAFFGTILKSARAALTYPNVRIEIPRTVVISTDHYDQFLEENDLLAIGLSDRPDEEILAPFQQAPLPGALLLDLESIIGVFDQPLAIRSSSILEDSRYQPFTGIYTTHMIPRASPSLMLGMLQGAIKSVYASVFFKASKAYMAATSNIIDQEKLGIIIQEVHGARLGGLYLPTLSGVARSMNYYPVGAEKPDEGVATVAVGLGVHISQGEVAIRFSPSNPQRILQLSQPDMALRQTQKVFYALSENPSHYGPSTCGTVNIRRLPIDQAQGLPEFPLLASTLDPNSQTLRDGIQPEGVQLVTFAGMLKHRAFPLATILKDILELAQREMGCHVEIEFSAHIHPPATGPSLFNLLQIKPMVESEQEMDYHWEGLNPEEAIVYSPSALGHGRIQSVADVVYVVPKTFNPAHTRAMASELEAINALYMEAKRNYMLIGPGRWGSSDPWLGIPIRWAQISEARVIVEYCTESFRVEPSYGTHFFQSLTAFRVGYLTVNPWLGHGTFSHAYLDAKPAWHSSRHIRCIQFPQALRILIDGRVKQGVVFKPTEG